MWAATSARSRSGRSSCADGGHLLGQVLEAQDAPVRKGKLSDKQEIFRRRNNSWYDAAYTDPSTVDPHVYDDEINPGAAAWFKPSATHLLARVSGSLEILSAHGVDCRALRSAAPGRVIYEDDVQFRRGRWPTWRCSPPSVRAD
ncbi:hypothetical protein [Streptomyces flaveolus]|uniref:hypothetical protein n=1 Tax=Streptomyces flaveolus TaxID=67297 RepID=UPI00369C1EC4